MLNASAIASRTIPSPTPILSSSVIVRVKYLASVADAWDNNSRIMDILRLVDFEPEIVVSFIRLSKTNLIVNGCEKKSSLRFFRKQINRCKSNISLFS